MPLRPATLEDQAVLYALHVELFREHIDKIWGWDEEWQITNFQKEWEEVVTEVIHSGNLLLGYVQTRVESDHIYVLSLGLNSRYQNQGLGTAAMNLIKERAMSMILPIRLSVFKTNPRVISFYERLGFEIHERTETGCKMFWLARPLAEIRTSELGTAD